MSEPSDLEPAYVAWRTNRLFNACTFVRSAADSGLSAFAADLWLEEGACDWHANGEALRGSAAVD